jgi:hypothetical protein
MAEISLLTSISANTDDGGVGREEFTREFLQQIDLAGLPPSILQLKVCAPIMLLRRRQVFAMVLGWLSKAFSQHVIYA